MEKDDTGGVCLDDFMQLALATSDWFRSETGLSLSEGEVTRLAEFLKGKLGG